MGGFLSIGIFIFGFTAEKRFFVLLAALADGVPQILYYFGIEATTDNIQKKRSI